MRLLESWTKEEYERLKKAQEDGSISEYDEKYLRTFSIARILAGAALVFLLIYAYGSRISSQTLMKAGTVGTAVFLIVASPFIVMTYVYRHKSRFKRHRGV